MNHVIWIHLAAWCRLTRVARFATDYGHMYVSRAVPATVRVYTKGPLAPYVDRVNH